MEKQAASEIEKQAAQEGRNCLWVRELQRKEL